MNVVSAPYRHSGMTLIELMIAMTLSLILAGGAIVLFVNTKSTYSLQQAVGRMQSDGNAAMTLLEQQIRLAGYPEDSLTLESGIVGTRGDSYTVQATATYFSQTESSDNSLIFQYEAPSNQFRNCAGETFAEGDVISVRIALSDPDGDGIGSLRCEGAASFADLVGAATGLTIVYGEDTDGDGAPNQYRTYDSVANLRNVVAIRLTYSVVADHDDVNPRLFSNTIALRNQVHLL